MWLGIDLGTQGVRAIVVSEDGTVVAASSQPLTSRRAGSRHEQDPEQWWRATVGACRQAVGQVSAPDIKGVAVDGTSGTILLLDKSGRPLTPGLMYDDSRAQAEAKRASEAGQAIWHSLGYRMQASWALPKLLWLLHEHGAPSQDSRLAHQADFITRRLAGCDVASDWSTALKTGYDLINERWPCDVLDRLEVPSSILPAVVEPGSQIGEICRETAEVTGIPFGTPIIAGMTDGCAAQIAAGALNEGEWNLVLGTTLVVKGVTRELLRDPAGMVYSHRLPERKWAPGGASNTGAGVIAELFPETTWDTLSSEASRREPTEVIAYPLLSRGERFPFNTPLAERFVIGQTSGDVELYAALMQGAGFIARLSLDYLAQLDAPVHNVAITGGATRSRYWCQLCADVLGRAVALPENSQPAFGMAVLAASGGRGLSETAKRMVSLRAVYEPRQHVHERLSELYVRMLDELVRRDWLSSQIAGSAREEL